MTTAFRFSDRRSVRLPSAMLIVLLLTFFFHIVIPLNSSAIGSIYLLTVLFLAASWGLSAAVVGSVTATACFNYFFLAPKYTLTIADPDNWVALITLLASALVASQLSNRAKRRAVEAMNRQMEMERLYSLSRALMLMDLHEHVAKRTAEEVARVYNLSRVAIYDSRTEDFHCLGWPEDLKTNMQKVASSGSAIRNDHILINPLIVADARIGSLAISSGNLSETASDALCSLIALSLDSARNRAVANRAEAERQSEQFKSTLLDGLAHEFKTPLTSIKAVTTLVLMENVSDSKQQRHLLTIVDQEADRLRQLVSEALDIARIEAGKIQLQLELHSIVDVVRRTLDQSAVGRNGRPTELSFAENLPELSIDRALIELALRQLLDNAYKYSPQHTPIGVSVTLRNERIEVGIHNWGNALSEQERLRVFDRFYRGHNSRQLAGTGMGLAIAREILRSHGGDILVESSSVDGTEFRATIPAPEKGRHDLRANTGS